MNINDVLKGLQAIMSRSSAESLGHMFLKNLKPEDVTDAIQKDLSLTKLCFNDFHLNHQMIKPFVRLILKANFKDIQKLLTDVPAVYAVLAENPRIMPVLNTYKGRVWLNRQCREMYEAMYIYTWKNGDPLQFLGLNNPYKR